MDGIINLYYFYILVSLSVSKINYGRHFYGEANKGELSLAKFPLFNYIFNILSSRFLIVIDDIINDVLIYFSISLSNAVSSDFSGSLTDYNWTIFISSR